jgi:uncharacterized membrane protein
MLEISHILWGRYNIGDEKMVTIWLTAVPIIALTIVVIGVYATRKRIQEKRSGFPLKDERSTKIQGKASSIAMQVGSWYMILLNFYNIFRIEFQGLRELSSMPVLNSTLIIMNVLYLILMSYYNRRDDF